MKEINTTIIEKIQNELSNYVRVEEGKNPIIEWVSNHEVEITILFFLVRVLTGKEWNRVFDCQISLKMQYPKIIFKFHYEKEPEMRKTKTLIHNS